MYVLNLKKKKKIKIGSCQVSGLDWLRGEYHRPFLSGDLWPKNRGDAPEFGGGWLVPNVSCLQLRFPHTSHFFFSLPYCVLSDFYLRIYFSGFALLFSHLVLKFIKTPVGSALFFGVSWKQKNPDTQF